MNLTEATAYFDARYKRKDGDGTPERPMITHEMMQNELMPPGLNFEKCLGAGCNHQKLQNAKLTRKFKSCKNCESNTVHPDNDYCPTCGAEDVDGDLFEDNGVDLDR